MSNKIWNFDILVDDCFVNFNTKKQEINPDHNDRLLSVANGFEDGSWRYRQFKEFVFSNIAETALSAQEREKFILYTQSITSNLYYKWRYIKNEKL